MARNTSKRDKATATRYSGNTTLRFAQRTAGCWPSSGHGWADAAAWPRTTPGQRRRAGRGQGVPILLCTPPIVGEQVVWMHREGGREAGMKREWHAVHLLSCKGSTADASMFSLAVAAGAGLPALGQRPRLAGGGQNTGADPPLKAGTCHLTTATAATSHHAAACPLHPATPRAPTPPTWVGRVEQPGGSSGQAVLDSRQCAPQAGARAGARRLPQVPPVAGRRRRHRRQRPAACQSC